MVISGTKERPCVNISTGRYCFPCISGLCPYEMDFMMECYPGLDSELMGLFDELFFLRTEISRRKLTSEHLVLEI
ncbi:MAG TPA: hypothetical protein EYP30_08245 [Archaeoglobaceae archaeon]|nr:hypothetical protein [Archaeoglobaceae archaeon]